MSYRAGIGGRLAALVGEAPTGPCVICDGCGVAVTIDGMPPKWFLARKPPRGWRGLRMADGSKRWDLCPRCWKEPSGEGGE